MNVRLESKGYTLTFEFSSEDQQHFLALVRSGIRAIKHESADTSAVRSTRMALGNEILRECGAQREILC